MSARLQNALAAARNAKFVEQPPRQRGRLTDLDQFEYI
jgi:hypothetical protein